MKPNVVSKWGSRIAIALLAAGIAGCAAIQAERQAQEQKQQQFVQHMDVAHIWVTNGDAPPGKPYAVLGDLSYQEPFNPDANDEAHMRDKLKQMALDKYTDEVDAVIKVHSDVSDDGKNLVVSAQAIKYESSADRTAMHKMNEGMVASPK